MEVLLDQYCPESTRIKMIIITILCSIFYHYHHYYKAATTTCWYQTMNFYTKPQNRNLWCLIIPVGTHLLWTTSNINITTVEDSFTQQDPWYCRYWYYQVLIYVRKWKDRGNCNHGWVHACHNAKRPVPCKQQNKKHQSSTCSVVTYRQKKNSQIFHAPGDADL